MPDRRGRFNDIVLGFDSLDGYLKGIRISGPSLAGSPTASPRAVFARWNRLSTGHNNGPNHLHGGLKGFDKVVWNAEPVASKDGLAVKFSY